MTGEEEDNGGGGYCTVRFEDLMGSFFSFLYVGSFHPSQRVIYNSLLVFVDLKRISRRGRGWTLVVPMGYRGCGAGRKGMGREINDRFTLWRFLRIFTFFCFFFFFVRRLWGGGGGGGDGGRGWWGGGWGECSCHTSPAREEMHLVHTYYLVLMYCFYLFLTRIAREGGSSRRMQNAKYTCC